MWQKGCKRPPVSKPRPALLFLSPVVPSASGSGPAIRAGAFLEALSVKYDITLVVASIYGSSSDYSDPLVAQCCREVEIIPLSRLLGWLKTGGDLSITPAHSVERIHVFRLILAPLVQNYLDMQPSARPLCTLDLDDYESKTHCRMAELYQATGCAAEAAMARRRAVLYTTLEQSYLPRFDTVYVCHGNDQAEMSDGHHMANVAVAPNVVRLPHAPQISRPANPLTLLFVGNFEYYPNVDAVKWFSSDMIPLIRQQTDAAFRFLIVGRQPGDSVQALAAIPEVTVVGEVPSVEPYYREADVVVAPIRAGGGTRIKILEALSFRCPVVTTSLGAEGLDLCHGKEVLIYDSAENFACGCVELMAHESRRMELGGTGFHWVAEHHTLNNIEALVLTDTQSRYTPLRIDKLNYPGDALALIATLAHLEKAHLENTHGSKGARVSTR
jgi:polysaccharide biosynthesis protein PslH